MPTGLDEQYTWMSLATLVAFVMVAWDMMAVRQAELARAAGRLPVKDTEEKKVEPVAEEATAAAETEKVSVAAQPVLGERVEAQKRSRKRRRNH